MKTHRWDVPATAGNATSTLTIPGDKPWRIAHGMLGLTTDATAANRYVRIQILDANDNLMLCQCAGAPVTASLTGQQHAFMQGIYRETAFISGVLQVLIAAGMILQPGWKLRTVVTAGVAGDSYSGNVILHEA